MECNTVIRNSPDFYLEILFDFLSDFCMDCRNHILAIFSNIN